jgi:hypothetical protein
MARTGRPRVVIDLDAAEKLGQLQCTLKECSAFLNIPEGTIANREDFTSAWKKGLETGKISLRRTQFRLAEKSAGMAIWLGKQYLGQTEKLEFNDERMINQEITFDDVPTNGDGMSRFERFLHK